jgi:hypothetical protein
MRHLKLMLVLMLAGVGLSLLVGCGSGGTSDATVTQTAQLSPQNVNNFVESVSNEIGCSYTETQSAPLLRGENTFLPIKKVFIEVSDMLKIQGVDTSNLRKEFRKTQTVNGECGGTITTVTSADGKSVSYSFVDYCNESSGGTQSIVNGGIAISTSASGGSVTVGFSTSSPLNMKSVNPNTNERVDVTLAISGGSFYSSDGSFTLEDEGTSSSKILTISSISIKDNVSGESYSFQNVRVNMNGSSTTFTASYTDPDLGVVTISSNGDLNTKNGSITISGANGQSAVITSSSTEGIFNVTSDGSTLGVMDCSTVSTSL